jgi:type I restriction enzyme S subunit
MKRYNSYKDSGIEWIGEIPEHWEVKPLKYNFDIIPSNIDKKSIEGETEVLLCNYVDVYKNDKITSNINFMRATASANQIDRLQLQKFDVIATKDSEDPNDIGVPAIVTEDLNGVVCGYHLTVFRSNSESNIGRYLFWFLKSNLCSQYFSTAARGITRYALGSSVFSDLPFLIVSKTEIEAIANYLDRKTTQIDDLIAKKEQFIRLLEEERVAVTNQAVTKGLDPTVAMKDSGVEWLGEIPEHWEVGKFNLLVNIRHGHQFMNYDFTENGIKIIKITQLHKNGFLDISNCSYISSNRLDEFSSIIIKENDILMCLTGGTIGKIIRVGKVSEPLLQNYRVGHFSSNDSKKIIDDYIFGVMSSDYLISQIFFQMRETGQPNIGMGDFSRMKISFPSITEQIEIVNHIKNKTTEIDTLTLKTQQEIDLLKEYKTALISEVVTGKVDVRGE